MASVCFACRVCVRTNLGVVGLLQGGERLDPRQELRLDPLHAGLLYVFVGIYSYKKGRGRLMRTHTQNTTHHGRLEGGVERLELALLDRGRLGGCVFCFVS